MLEFGDLNFIWFNSKSSRCDLYGETIIMRFFLGVCGGSRGIEPIGEVWGHRPCDAGLLC